MKFKSLHEKAKQLDNLIEKYRETKQTGFVSMEGLKEMVSEVFPGAVMFDYGLHKTVFRLRHKSHLLVLKVGKTEAIERDHDVYKQLPSDSRHVYFARIFWHTKYCLLQEYGVQTEVSPENLGQLRSVAEAYGLLDITCDNVRNVNGTLKIIDASLAPEGFFRLWKTADIIKTKLPPPIRQAIRKTRLLRSLKEK